MLSKRLIQLFQQQAKKGNNQSHSDASDATAATSQGSVGPSQSLIGVNQLPKAGRMKSGF